MKLSFTSLLQITCFFLFFWLSSGHQAAAQSIDSLQTKGASIEYLELEVKPEFPGGIPGLMQYLGSNVTIPKHLKTKKFEGLAVATFVIDKKGEIESVKIVKSLHPDFDQELVKTIKNMPLWKPGEQNGEQVKVKFTVPFRVKL